MGIESSQNNLTALAVLSCFYKPLKRLISISMLSYPMDKSMGYFKIFILQFPRITPWVTVITLLSEFGFIRLMDYWIFLIHNLIIQNLFFKHSILKKSTHRFNDGD